MKSEKRIRDTVYVVGAGFSAGLGYPITKSLLIDAWDRLPKDSRDQLSKIIQFHHPYFTRKRTTSFPDIEQLLTEMVVNLQMFDASRPTEGTFTKDQLKASWEILLFTIAKWFHEIYEDKSNTDWLNEIVKRLQRENAAIISLNWDLILDQLLFGGSLDSKSYGLSAKLGSGPLLLKRHGSLNWYQGRSPLMGTRSPFAFGSFPISPRQPWQPAIATGIKGRPLSSAQRKTASAALWDSTMITGTLGSLNHSEFTGAINAY